MNLKRRTPLKRSPMKPSQSQLKRTGKLNRRSKTNSRPHEDVELRRRYMEENPECELTPILMGCGLASWGVHSKAWGDVGFAILDPNHIFSMGSRPDVWSNLIALCRPVHDWFHANLVEGRICCLWRKVFNPRFDVAEISEAAGQSVLGWLENHPVEEAFVDQLRREAVAFLKSA